MSTKAAKAAAPKTPKTNPTETEDPKGKSGSKAVVSNKKRDADSDRKRKANDCEDDESIASSVATASTTASDAVPTKQRLTRQNSRQLSDGSAGKKQNLVPVKEDVESDEEELKKKNPKK